MPEFGFDVYKFDENKFDDQTISKIKSESVVIQETLQKALERVYKEGFSVGDSIALSGLKILKDMGAIAEKREINLDKVIKDDPTISDRLAKILTTEKADSLGTDDWHVITASPDAKERLRIRSRVAMELFKETVSRVKIKETIKAGKTDQKAFVFIGVDGVNVNAYNLQISDSENDRVSSCSFTVKTDSNQVIRAMTSRSPISILVVEEGISYLFGGRLKNPTIGLLPNGQKIINVNAEDYTAEASDFKVTGLYSGNAKDVLEEMWGDYYEYPIVFDIQDTDREVEILLNYESLDKATENVIDQLGWSWFVDYDGAVRILKAFPPEFNVAKRPVSQWEILTDSVQIEKDEEIYNALYFFGGKGTSDEIAQTIISDGSNNIFSLNYSPIDLSVERDGVDLSVGVENLHDFEDGYDVLLNFNEKTIKFEDIQPEGTELINKYKYRFPIVIYMEASSSITEYGKVVKKIEDDSISSPEKAREKAEDLLRRNQSPKTNVSFTTKEPGLQAGMFATIDCPDLDADGIYKIVEVNKTVEPLRVLNQISFEKVARSSAKFVRKIQEIEKRVRNLESKDKDEDMIVQEFRQSAENIIINTNVENTITRVGVDSFDEARFEFGLFR